MREAVIVVALVVASTVVATFADRLRVPAPSVLVLAGIAVALVPGVPAVRSSPELISLFVLPPLLYASAQDISARELRAMWRPVAALALGLVLATALTIAGLAWWITSLSLPMAFVLGAVLASTDPVAVTALGRRLPLPPRIQALVQTESLFNDATSLVLFQVAVGIAAGSGSTSPIGAGWRFVLLAGGGAGIGAALAGSVIAVRRQTADPGLHTVIALVTPYAAYLLAQRAGVSGVTAVVVAGVVVGSAGHKITDARIRLQVHAVYDALAFLLESVVFALVGLQLPLFVRDLGPGSHDWPLQALALSAALVAARLAWMRATVPHAAPTRGYPAGPVARVMTWAGTRGVMPLAAALAIPLTTAAGYALPGRPLVLVLTAAVVTLTLVTQGLTLAPVVRTSGLALDPEHVAAKEAEIHTWLNEAVLDYLDDPATTQDVPPETLDRLRRRHTARLVGTSAHLERRLVDLQRAELRRLYTEGRVNDAVRRRIQHQLDRTEAGIR
ncbi:Na+/H+ antiporter [Actinospica robiniae]|uniref:Na+/H+ antiporter n=1 Tax=Actinospica robiniae TaxID=304901 RepID=UPI00042A6968|nr:Na+/H+ antiporter [Actinospica robiniae]